MNKKYMQADAGGPAGGGADAPSPSGDAGLSRGAAAFEPVPKSTTGEAALPEPKTKPEPKEPPGSGPEGAQTPAQPAAFDPEKFAKDFSGTLAESLKPIIEAKQSDEPPMSVEEARKVLNIWEPDDAWYAQYDNLETRKDAVLSMRDSLINQADTLAKMRFQEMLDKFREEIMPTLQRVTETENRQREERLHTRYPTLAKPELQPLINAIAQDFTTRKQTFKTEGELFKAVADGVEAVLKVNNPEFKLEAAATGNGQPQKTEDRGGRNLPVTSPGGGGGTGRRESGDSKVAKPRGLAIFDK